METWIHSKTIQRSRQAFLNSPSPVKPLVQNGSFPSVKFSPSRNCQSLVIKGQQCRSVFQVVTACVRGIATVAQAVPVSMLGGFAGSTGKYKEFSKLGTYEYILRELAYFFSDKKRASGLVRLTTQPFEPSFKEV